jgi:hypothetical protein
LKGERYCFNWYMLAKNAHFLDDTSYAVISESRYTGILGSVASHNGRDEIIGCVRLR